MFIGTDIDSSSTGIHNQDAVSILKKNINESNGVSHDRPVSPS